MKIIDAIKFILQYRKNKAFVDWSIPQLTVAIHKCITNNTVCCVEENSNIVGIMIGEVDGSSFHIHNILSIRRNMPLFIRFILDNYPNVTNITTIRHMRQFKSYPINEKTINKFMKGTK